MRSAHWRSAEFQGDTLPHILHQLRYCNFCKGASARKRVSRLVRLWRLPLGDSIWRWALPRVRSKPYFYVVGSAHPTVIENGARSQLRVRPWRALALTLSHFPPVLRATPLLIPEFIVSLYTDMVIRQELVNSY
jgi:hypothetical protein